MNKKYLILFIILTNFLNIYSKERFNAIEFQVGASLNSNFLYEYISISMRNEDNTESFNRRYKRIEFFNIFITNYISVPVSFYIYFNKYFALGFIYSIGCEINTILSIYDSNIENIGILNRFKLVNKIGNYHKGQFVVIEYGYLMLAKVFYYPYDHFYSAFFQGPTFFIGYEFSVGSAGNIVYSIGQILDIQIYHNYIEPGSTRKYDVKTGIELRIGFKYKRELT